MRNPFARLPKSDVPGPSLRDRLNSTKAKARQVFAVNKALMTPLPKPTSAVDRTALVNYASWLSWERSLVCRELYPHMGTRCTSFVLGLNAAERWHFRGPNRTIGDVPPASGRALKILDMVGVDWRADLAKGRNPDLSQSGLRDNGERPELPSGWPALDAELVEAAGAVIRLDAAIEAVLPDAYDDPDDLPGYTDLNEARNEALSVLSTVRAQGMPGLQAKAKTLLTVCVASDDQTTRLVAQSLARDLVAGRQDMIEPAAVQTTPLVLSPPNPALAAMVAEWLEIRERFDGGNGPEDDEEANLLHRHWVDLQLAIYRFPAGTLADLQAKTPVFLDELGTLKAGGEASCPDLPATAWRGVLADIARLASTIPSVAITAPGRSLWGMPAIDLKGLPLSDLRRLHEVAKLVGDVGSAVLCQPRCLAEGRPERPAPGVFAEWITEACNTLQGNCEEEARRRVGTTDRCDKERLCILADATVENGDPEEIRAFVRDLAASV